MIISVRLKRQLTSTNCVSQYLGASFYNWRITIISLSVLIMAMLVLVVLGLRSGCQCVSGVFSYMHLDSAACAQLPLRPICLGLSLLFCLWAGSVVHYLTPIFILRKKEARITWSQILFLFSIGLVVTSLVEYINPAANSVESMLLGGLGFVLSWIFQDTIKSVVAFFYLRANSLLKIDDWIIVASHNIDGIVKKISLTTVTVENWDTTLSSFPTYILQAEHFQNLQAMLAGKTHGRQMLRTFIIDTGWIHPLTAREVEEIKKQLGDSDPFVVESVKVGRQNISVFRDYVYQMLLTNPKVSHHPRLMVRWLEQQKEGLPLQMYCYITDTGMDVFEWVQSQITEKFVEALPWFGLQLYQSASGYDVSNGNIFMSPNPASYEK